jgi:AraC-like DNA-binding protein
MATTFTTKDVSGADKVAYWEELLGRFFSRVDLNCDREEPFDRWTTVWELGPLSMTTYRADRGHAARTKRHIAHAPDEAFSILLLKRGRLRLSQRGRASMVEAGHLCLFDANEPFEFEPSNLEMLTMRLPTRVLRQRVPNLADHCPVPIDTRHGAGRLASDLFQGVVREADTLNDRDVTVLFEHVADMVAMALTADAASTPTLESAARHGLYYRICSFINQHLDDPELTPSRVADGAGISLRYLHRIFEDTQETFGSYLRRQRLLRSLQQLQNPLLSQRPVANIAYDCGFRSAPHFTSAFRRQFGMTPTEARRLALTSKC